MHSAPSVFDRNAVRRNLRRALALRPATFLLERVADELADRLSLVTRTFAIAADLGTLTNALRIRLLEGGRVSRILALSETTDELRSERWRAVGDLETLPLKDESLDLAVSGLALHFVNDLPGMLVQVRRALKADGLFLAALFGGTTLAELRESFAVAEAEVEHGVSPRVAPFADVNNLGMLLQRAGFALPVADTERVIVRYETPFALLQDLRRMGAANSLNERRRVPLKRATLARMAEIYAERFADADGRVRATFEIIWLSGWKPHESQQKPLRPGTARMRLADVLRTREFSAGEKAGSE